MDDEFHPRYPKATLHEVVTQYIDSLRALGRKPECSVAFVRRDGSITTTLEVVVSAESDAWNL